ncbi:MAG: UvrD-helicase domain-containing protein [Kiritimatiellae bacterium]|nr:UvrD-helicase domain-containing protein [Kiritimatiellia bacterium]
MKLPPLTVIEASAGTGKTFTLVTRLLQLIFNGTPPERIVALTFSRMAAGEIFNSFIERLSNAAKDPENAAKESANIGRDLTTSDFSEKLREVISRQHLSLIGTLDSFMMRVVRMIPLELGLGGELAIMSEYRSPVERMRIVGEMMRRENDETKAIFREAFRLAFGNSGSRKFLESFSGFIDKWHTRFRDLMQQGAGIGAWGDAKTIWGGIPPENLDVTISEIRALAEKISFKPSGKNQVDAFRDAVREFSGTIPELNKTKQQDPYAVEAYQKMVAWKIAKSLRQTQGIFLLMSAYEAAYASKVRARGLITFDDLPRLFNSLPQGVKLPLEYRMDARFDHWALDEFQDTSRGQWKALDNIIGEAAHPDSGKSVFIVGDRKQSIYEWRGGDVSILGRQVEYAGKEGNCLKPLDRSYRYVSVISDAVNAIFDENVIRSALDMDGAPDCATWKCRHHVSNDEKTEGFIQVIQAEKNGRSANISNFFEPIENALMAVKPWERGISTAILVRGNKSGEQILAYLKSKGISNVVFEGESSVSDSPVLAAMTELVKLAEHSNDAFSYSHIKYSPIGKALYPDGLPEADELSAQLLEDFTRAGMVRKFREVREALKSIPDTWNDFTESRFEDFIKCAAEFEEVRDSTMRLSDFVEFVSKKTQRDFAEPGMVRIMTMHQSKGLGFEWVVIPFYEQDGFVSAKHTGPLENSDPDWIMENPGSAATTADPVLMKAERRRRQIQVYNSLCLDYVAMTRAKRALTVILHPQNKTPPKMPQKFSDLLRAVNLQTKGDPGWYLPYKKTDPAGGKSEKSTIVRGKRQTVKKLRPSESFYSGLKADALFGDDFGKAAEFGTQVHAQYEKVEWIDGPEAKTPFDRALVKPEGHLSLWREKSYELFVDGKWESGQFDRVVFTSMNGEKKAVICDFKTNSIRKEETAGEFAQRMRCVYSKQMNFYRRALSLLTGIAECNIRTLLLLYSTKDTVEV